MTDSPLARRDPFAKASPFYFGPETYGVGGPFNYGPNPYDGTRNDETPARPTTEGAAAPRKPGRLRGF